MASDVRIVWFPNVRK